MRARHSSDTDSQGADWRLGLMARVWKLENQRGPAGMSVWCVFVSVWVVCMCRPACTGLLFTFVRDCACAGTYLSVCLHDKAINADFRLVKIKKVYNLAYSALITHRVVSVTSLGNV